MDRRIAEIAGRQAGVVSVEQLHEIGLTKAGIARRVRKGLLHPLHRGLYAVGHTALTRRGWEWAAVLACGSDAVLSHTTAGALWALIAPERTIGEAESLFHELLRQAALPPPEANSPAAATSSTASGPRRC